MKDWRWEVTFLTVAVLVCTGCETIASRGSFWSKRPLFVEETRNAGLAYSGHGKCIAFGDFNADGYLDIFASIIGDSDRFYMNHGDGTFTNETASTGIKAGSDGHGAVFADYNNDGMVDLFVASDPELGGNPAEQYNRLYMGSVQCFLYERAKAAGIEGKLISPRGEAGGQKLNRSCGVAVGDYDNDGDLDIYIAKGSYRTGFPNALYRNDGKARPRFTDVAEQSGVADLGAGEYGGGYVCAFADFDDDGFPDLFIGNLDIFNNGVGWRLFRNKGGGKFADVSKESGVGGSGMCASCAVGDIDNDGDLDLFVGIGDAKRANLLYLNNGNFKFCEVAEGAGLAEKLMVRGSCMADVNHDGYLDILVAEQEGGKLYLNQGDLTFREYAKQEGIYNPLMHGCAFGDVDNDGDLDLYTSNWRMMAEPGRGDFLFFRNQLNDKNWLKVRVKGTKSNRSAVGARLWVYDAGYAENKAYLRGFREIQAGSGVYSTAPLEQHFGLDGHRKYDLVVYFPTTKRKVVLREIVTGQILEVTEPAS